LEEMLNEGELKWIEIVKSVDEEKPGFPKTARPSFSAQARGLDEKILGVPQPCPIFVLSVLAEDPSYVCPEGVLGGKLLWVDEVLFKLGDQVPENGDEARLLRQGQQPGETFLQFSDGLLKKKGSAKNRKLVFDAVPSGGAFGKGAGDIEEGIKAGLDEAPKRAGCEEAVRESFDGSV
jgi:hypothetical protein